ncbi:hypothetical protein ILUMI_22369 [Ignelater luminosus]|uniref:USP domain-containing protein n=1 Tax=Ignelater luminosus TaxID=2038154 RepID=A0A8K0G2Y7_IGNLU|nr:hypothetical protein ILUMI_22369 [Ignelater luminosus]
MLIQQKLLVYINYNDISFSYFLGGHYFSYIRHDNNTWYLFNDEYVGKVNLHIDEEMQGLCFGGQFGTFSAMKKPYSAYMLFYTRTDGEYIATTALGTEVASQTNKNAQEKDVFVLHKSCQFEVEYIEFIKKLLQDNMPSLSDIESNVQIREASVLSFQLACKYLFQTGWHAKINLRGSAALWSDVLCQYLQSYPEIRSWFAIHILFRTPKILFEYLVRCPVNDVKLAFRKVLAMVTSLLHDDGPCPPPPNYTESSSKLTMGDYIMGALLDLLVTEIPAHLNCISTFCEFFYAYAEQGDFEIKHMLDLNILPTFILVAINEGPNPNIKYKLQSLTELHRIIFILVRSSDCKAPGESENLHLEPNKFCYSRYPLVALEERTRRMLFDQTKYLDSSIQEISLTEECLQFLQYCAWENKKFSGRVLTVLVKNMTSCPDCMFAHFKCLLLGILLLKDSLQSFRLNYLLHRTEYATENIISIIINLSKWDPQRTYQCIRFMVDFFFDCQEALTCLFENIRTLDTWHRCMDWLEEQITMGPGSVSESILKRTASMSRIYKYGRNLELILCDENKMPTAKTS